MEDARDKRTYTIDSQNRLSVERSRGRIPEGMVSFRSESELEALVADWPGSRLLEIWNRLPDTASVKKFTDRKTAARRIWKAIENLTRPPRRQIKTQAPAVPSAGTKSETVLTLLRQPGGASLKALMAATGWQAHSVREFLSGQISKKMPLKIRSFKRARDGERVYSIRP